MSSVLRPLLYAGILLAALPAWGVDVLPQLPSSGPGNLPSLNSTPINMAAMPDQTLTVTCYLGNPNDKNSLGSIATSAAAAGATCNSVNYVCQGRCFGCYSDFDLSEDICVDSAGRKFIR